MRHQSNWLLHLYNKKNKVIATYRIMDRTIDEANTESMRALESGNLEECNDYSLTEIKGKFDKSITEL